MVIANNKNTRYRNNLTVVHQNIQSLRNKQIVLEVITETTPADILCLSEHWLAENELFVINGYKIVAKYCRSNIKNGGVCIFVKKHIKTTQCKLIDSIKCVEKHFEYTATIIEGSEVNLALLVIYRTPDSDVDIFLRNTELLLSKLSRKYPSIIICGDFNIDLQTPSKKREMFLNLLSSFNLTATIISPTHFTKTSCSTIDNIITNIKPNIYTSEILNLGLNSHLGQVITIQNFFTSKSHTMKIKKRDFRENNIHSFIECLEMEDWSSIFATEYISVDEMFKLFLTKFKLRFDQCFPHITVRVNHKRRNKWITNGIRRSCQKMKTLNLISKQTTDIKFIEYFKNYKKIYRKVIKQAKSSYYDNLINKADNKTKMAWNLIKQETNMSNKASGNIELKTENNQICNDPHAIAEIFNSFFNNVVDKLLNARPNAAMFIDEPHPIPHVSNSFFLTPTDPYEIIAIVKKFKNRSSAGPDEIPEFVIKRCIHAIATPLSDLINASFNHGQFPENLKWSLIRPLHKKGDKRNCENYRPISLSSKFSKIIESIMKKRLLSHLEQNKIISNSQHGFLKNRSTTTAILSYIQEIVSAIDSKSYPFSICCDLSKAFDCVNHSLLLSKLSSYGIRGTTNEWFSSYLKNRHQYVELTYTDQNMHKQKISSKPSLVNLGVPQGSVLGPLLFLIYINDLPSHIDQGTMVLYADDTNILIKGSNASELQDNINAASNKLEKWFYHNNLILNANKTNCLFFFPSYTAVPAYPKLTISNTNTECVSSTKFLGLYIDNKLSWKTHITNLCRTLSTNIFLIRSLSTVLNKKALISLYYGTFYSRAKYGILFWGSSSGLLTVFRLQKKVIRIITHTHLRASCRQIFKKLNLLTVPCLYIYEVLKLIKSNLDGYTTHSDIHRHDTRMKNDLRQMSHRTKIFERSPHYFGIALYNKLPQTLKNIKDINIFCREVRKMLTNKTYYTVDEYLQD